MITLYVHVRASAGRRCASLGLTSAWSRVPFASELEFTIRDWIFPVCMNFSLCRDPVSQKRFGAEIDNIASADFPYFGIVFLQTYFQVKSDLVIHDRQIPHLQQLLELHDSVILWIHRALIVRKRNHYWFTYSVIQQSLSFCRDRDSAGRHIACFHLAFYTAKWLFATFYPVAKFWTIFHSRVTRCVSTRILRRVCFGTNTGTNSESNPKSVEKLQKWSGFP